MSRVDEEANAQPGCVAVRVLVLLRGPGCALRLVGGYIKRDVLDRSTFFKPSFCGLYGYRFILVEVFERRGPARIVSCRMRKVRTQWGPVSHHWR